MEWLPSGYTLTIKDFQYETNIYRPGNYSKVYRAVWKPSVRAQFRNLGVSDTLLNTIPSSFALKIIDKGMLKRLAYRHPHVQKEVMQEKQTALRLNGYQHYFPRLYTTFQDSTSLYFLYEYIDQGQELWDYIMDTVSYQGNYTGKEFDILWHHHQFNNNTDMTTNLSPSNIVSSSSFPAPLLPSALNTFINDDIQRSYKTQSSSSHSFLPRSPIPLPVSTVQKILYQLIQGIRYLHSQGIVHRDLKPENILIDLSKAVMHCCIVDFGTVKNIMDETYNNPSDFVGTPDYMPPEALETKSSTNPKNNSTRTNTDMDNKALSDRFSLRTDCTTDLWALGCIVYQLLCGSPPFHSPSAYLTFEKILSYDRKENNILEKKDNTVTELLFPPNVPEEAKDFITRLLQRDRYHRFGVVKKGGQEPGCGVQQEATTSVVATKVSVPNLLINYDLLLNHSFLTKSYVSSPLFNDSEVSLWRNKIGILAKMITTELYITIPSSVLVRLCTVTTLDHEKEILPSLCTSTISLSMLENWLKWRRILLCTTPFASSAPVIPSGNTSTAVVAPFISLTEIEKYELIHYLALRRQIHRPHILLLFVSNYTYARSLSLRLYDPVARVPYLLGGGGGGYHSSYRELYGWNIASDKDDYDHFKDELSVTMEAMNANEAPLSSLNNDADNKGNTGWKRIEEYSWSQSFFMVCLPNPRLSLPTNNTSQTFLYFTTMIQSINRLNPPPRAVIILGQLIDSTVTDRDDRQRILDHALEILSHLRCDSINIVLITEDTYSDNYEVPSIPRFLPSNLLQYRFSTQWIQGCRMYTYAPPSLSSSITSSVEAATSPSTNLALLPIPHSLITTQELHWLQKDIAVMRSVAQHSLLWYHTSKISSTEVEASSILSLESLTQTILQQQQDDDDETMKKKNNGHNIRYINTTSLDTWSNDTNTNTVIPPYRTVDQYVDGETNEWQPLRKKEIRTLSNVVVSTSRRRSSSTDNNNLSNPSLTSSSHTAEYPIKIIQWPSLAGLCTLLSTSVQSYGTNEPSPSSTETLVDRTSLVPSTTPTSAVLPAEIVVSFQPQALIYIPTIKISSLRLEPGYVKVNTHTDTIIDVTLLPNEEHG